MPDRCAALPPAIFEALRGVDLVLHAGDLGELWVLDQLSGIAPVVAVHGNDETAEAQRELPYQQVLAVGGARVLLCHSHSPDRDQEIASRQDDEITPKLDRLGSMAGRTGSSLLVFGHWHIPLATRRGGLLLINPGAIASPNPWTRGRVQTVALLYVLAAGPLVVVHIDLSQPDRAFDPAFDPEAGFEAHYRRFSERIIDPTLLGAGGSALRLIPLSVMSVKVSHKSTFVLAD